MYCLKMYTKNNIKVLFSTCCILNMLDFGLSELERKVYNGCAGSKFYTKLGIEIDTKGIIVTHCRLELLEVLNFKVLFAHVMG